jgi:glutamyl-tRNA reductase
MNVRDAMALNPQQIHVLLRICRREGLFDEGALLSTCNRTDLYYVGDGFDPGRFLANLARVKNTKKIQDRSPLYQKHNTLAVRHLFHVAAGMDSAVPGEHEILGQVKRAYRMGLKARTARFILSRLFHRAFRAGKRVRSETCLGEGSTSLPAAAVELLEAERGSLKGSNVVILGAGEGAELAARACLNSGVRSITVANRNLKNAKGMLQRVGGSEVDNDDSEPSIHSHCEDPAGRGGDQALFRTARPTDISSTLRSVDFLIAATSSPGFMLTAGQICPALKSRVDPLYVVDIAIPRDIDPAIVDCGNVRLYDTEDIEQRVEQNIRNRSEDMPRAERIIDEEVSSFEIWKSRLSLDPTIKQLVKRFCELSNAEMEKHASEFCQRDQEMLRKFTRSLRRKFVHYPIAFLKEAAAGRIDRETEAEDLVRSMFELDERGGRK